MKPIFLLLLCFALACSVFAGFASNEKASLEQEIRLLMNGLESTEIDLARSHNSSDPEYAEYQGNAAIYQSNLQLTQNALRASQSEHASASKQVLVGLSVASAFWVLWLCGYVLLWRTERRFMVKFNRCASLSLCTLAGGALGTWISALLAAPFYYGAWGAFLIVSPVFVPIFAWSGLKIGSFLARWLDVRPADVRCS